MCVGGGVGGCVLLAAAAAAAAADVCWRRHWQMCVGVNVSKWNGDDHDQGEILS